MSRKPESSSESLAAFSGCGLTTLDPSAALDRLTEMAARVFDVPIACISWSTEKQTWFMSTQGLERGVVPREPGLCDVARKHNGVYHLVDASLDPTARQHSVVQAGVRFYAGAPVRLGEGAFCLMGFEPREFTLDEQRTLLDFARLAMNELDRCRAEADLAQAQQELTRTEEGLRDVQRLESLGVMAGGIAHDFNNLLVGILGNAGLVLSQLSDDSPFLESMRTIETVALRASELTNQMLSYSGKSRSPMETCDLSDVVSGMTELLDVAIGKRAVVQYDLSPDPVQVQGTAAQLRQVLMNLATNASEAMGGRPGTIRIATGIETVTDEFLAGTCFDDNLPGGQYATLGVVDTGLGMDAETRMRIFDPFFTTKATGRGIGLASVIGIIRRLRGAVALETAVGKGTSLRVLLPHHPSEAPAVHQAEPCLSRWQGAGKILVVDDELLVLRFASRLLERAGFEVLTALDGEEGLRSFSEYAEEIRAVLLDVTMPGKDGARVYHEMRAIRPDTPIVFSSGYNKDRLSERLHDRPLHFLKKPYSPGKLIETLRTAIEN